MRPRVWLVLALFVAVVATLSARPQAHTAQCTEGFCLFASVGKLLLPAYADDTPVPDLVLVNGMIYTADPARPRVEAVAIKGERIIALGSSKEIRALVGRTTRIVNLKGRFAMPGFNDAHTHLASGGQAKLTVDLEGAKSLAEFQERIRARLNDYQPGEWVTGRGWDHTLWSEQRFPTRQDLDAVSTDHPMFFGRVSGHVAVANTKALEIAGITRSTPNPSGGEIERDANGEATGMLKETAMGLVAHKIPDLTPEKQRQGIEMALAEAARYGVTSIQDNSGWDDFKVYEQLKREGKLTARITEWLPFTASLERLKEMRDEGGTIDIWLRTGALKGVVDGALGSGTAALLAPYSDNPASSGILILEAQRLKQMAIERDKAGFQIALHAIGDRANRVALDAFAAARAANGARDSRHKIEHAQVVASEDFARFHELGVIASMQPCHQTTDMRWAEKRLGPERVKGAYAWNTMLQNNVRMAFGTDYPVESINPLRGLYACVTRQLPDNPPRGGWQPQERISLDTCIREYTLGSAYAEFMEMDKGQIAVGKLADIIVLSADITQIPSPQLFKTEVLMTFVGGRAVYEKK